MLLIGNIDKGYYGHLEGFRRSSGTINPQDRMPSRRSQVALATRDWTNLVPRSFLRDVGWPSRWAKLVSGGEDLALLAVGPSAPS